MALKKKSTKAVDAAATSNGMNTHEQILAQQREQDVKKPPFYWNMPWNVIAEINRLGYNYTWKDILKIYLGVIGAMCLLGFFFKLTWYWYIVLCLVGSLVAPKFVANNYKNKFEATRFDDVNTYIEQMLYAFANSNRVLTALHDVQILFLGGPMREAIDEAITIIESPNENAELDLEEVALEKIAERYPNQYVRQMHRFLLKVERVGGSFEEATQLLIQNRVNWQARIDYVVRQEKKKRNEILISCGLGIGLVMVMLYILPSEVTIFGNTLVQIFNVITIIGCVLIYQRADSKLALNLVKTDSDRTEEECFKDYDSYIHYDKKEGFKKAAKFAIVPAVIAVIYLIVSAIMSGFTPAHFGIFMGIMGVAALFEFSEELGYKAKKSRLQREIMCAFPEWLLEMSLLLQSDNVQVSIFKSEETVRPVLKPELQKMIAEIKESPAQPEPFLNFCRVFELRTVTTSMQMLYSLSIGSGGDPQKQIKNIVERNNRDMDQAEKARCENRLAGMTLLFYLPVLLSSVALMVDMMIFLTMFMGTMNVNRFTDETGQEAQSTDMAYDGIEADGNEGVTPFFDKDGNRIYYDESGKMYTVIGDGIIQPYDDAVMYDDKGNEYKVADFLDANGGFIGLNYTGFTDENGHLIYYANDGQIYTVIDGKVLYYEKAEMYGADGAKYNVADFYDANGFIGISHTGFYTETGDLVYYDKKGEIFTVKDGYKAAYTSSMMYDSDGQAYLVEEFIGSKGFIGVNYTGYQSEDKIDIYYDNNGNMFTIDSNHTVYPYNQTVMYDEAGQKYNVSDFVGTNGLKTNSFGGIGGMSNIVILGKAPVYAGSGVGGSHTFNTVNTTVNALSGAKFNNTFSLDIKGLDDLDDIHDLMDDSVDTIINN